MVLQLLALLSTFKIFAKFMEILFNSDCSQNSYKVCSKTKAFWLIIHINVQISALTGVLELLTLCYFVNCR